MNVCASGPYFKAITGQVCPSDASIITSVACKEAAGEMGDTFGSETSNTDYPLGCFYSIFGKMYFNRHLNESSVNHSHEWLPHETIQSETYGGMCYIGKSYNRLFAQLSWK